MLLEVAITLEVGQTLYPSQLSLYSIQVSVLRLPYIDQQGCIGTSRAFLQPRLYWAESNYINKVESLLIINTILQASTELNPQAYIA